MENTVKGTIKMIGLIVDIAGIVVGVISIIVTSVSILQSARKDKRQKSNRSTPKD